MGEIENIKEWLEKWHKIVLPEVEVRYSDDIENALCINVAQVPRRMSPAMKDQYFRETNSELRLRGLKDDELEGIDPSKFTIFLPRRYPNYPTGL